MALGVSYETFLHLNPRKLERYEEGFKIRKDMLDEDMWHMGIYIMRSVGVAVEHCLSGSKAKSEYFNEPICAKKGGRKGEPERELTEEEKKQAREQVLMQLKIMMSNFNTSKKS